MNTRAVRTACQSFALGVVLALGFHASAIGSGFQTPATTFAGGAITSAITGTGATVTADSPVLDLTQTWNNGAVNFNALRMNVTNTASGGASNLLTLQVGGSTVMRVAKNGTAIAAGGQYGDSAYAADANAFGFLTRSTFSSASDGVMVISNHALTDFTRLQFGGTSSSFPAIKRNGTTLSARLADDSGDAGWLCGTITCSSNMSVASGNNLRWATSTVMTDQSINGNLQIKNSAGTGFTSLAFGSAQSGTDTDSTSNVTVSTGVGTGIGASGDLRVRTGARTLNTTSTTAQSIGDRITVCAKSLALSTTSATATSFASLSTTTGTSIGGRCTVTVDCTDGTEFATASGSFVFSATNKAGSALVQAGSIVSTVESTAVSSAPTLGTTCGATVVGSGSNVLLKVTPVFSGTAAGAVTFCKVTWQLETNGLTTVTTQ